MQLAWVDLLRACLHRGGVFPQRGCYRLGTVNLNTVNSNFHLIQGKTLLTNDFELTVPDLYPDPEANTPVNLNVTAG